MRKYYKREVMNGGNLVTVIISLVAQTIKNLPAMEETEFNPWVRKILWRRKWQSTPLFLPGESHAGWVKELDQTFS